MTAKSAYEKMLQDPKNRVSSSGMMKQPMPGNSDVQGADMGNVPGNESVSDINSQEKAYMAGIDARMAARQAGINENTGNPALEKRVKDIEELLVEVMKTHMKLIEKLK